MTKATLLLLLYRLMLFVAFSDAQIIDCNFYQNLLPDVTYYVYNPEYPHFYRGEQSCVWTLKSNYRISLKCGSFQLPKSQNCQQDYLDVEVGSNTHRYCGNGTFSVQSEGDTMTVILSAPPSTTGGRFLCTAQAIENPGNVEENCKCGWKNPTRIVGGNETGVNEYPMTAGLVDAVDRIIFCGATIISPKYVVTAAHCLIKRSRENLGVIVGEHDTTTNRETNATVLYRVLAIHIHPNYVRTSEINDVAVVKTDGVIRYSNQVGPACLPFQHAPDTFGGSYVNVLGWGLTDYGGPKATALQGVTLSVLTYLQCSRTYRNVSRNQICTYAPEKDSCQMDSGGPVLWQNPTSRRLVLVGIISYGLICGELGSVNTRVGAYTDWITSVTPDETYCINE